MNCSICNTEIGAGQYFYDSYGHFAHSHHSIEYCPICQRIIGKYSSNGKTEYSDGRFICGFCNQNEKPVRETSQLNQIYFAALGLLKEKGFEFPKNIKVSLVSMEVFREAGYPPTIYGLNTSQVGVFEVKHHVKVLWGLPMLLCTGVVAHELLHVWQNSEGLKPETTISEGLCELGAALVYKRSGSKLGELLFSNTEKNLITEYSEGFKIMKHLLEKHGWQSVRDYVTKNSKKTFSY